MAQWYYTENNEQHGPVTEEKIKEMIGNGRLSFDSLVWTPGKKDWSKVGLVDELSSYLITPPPLPGPLEISQTFAVPANYGWRRFFAKTLDFLLAGAIASFTLAIFVPSTPWVIILTMTAFGIIAWLAIESASQCNTIGRKILGIKVEKINPDANWVNRAFHVLARGMLFEIPIISLIPKGMAFFSYRNSGETPWDRGNFRVFFTKNSFKIYLWALLYLSLLASLHGISFSLYSNRLQNKLNSVEYELSKSSEPPPGIMRVPVYDITTGKISKGKDFSISLPSDWSLKNYPEESLVENGEYTVNVTQMEFPGDSDSSTSFNTNRIKQWLEKSNPSGTIVKKEELDSLYFYSIGRDVAVAEGKFYSTLVIYNKARKKTYRFITEYRTPPDPAKQKESCLIFKQISTLLDGLSPQYFAPIDGVKNCMNYF